MVVRDLIRTCAGEPPTTERAPCWPPVDKSGERERIIASVDGPPVITGRNVPGISLNAGLTEVRKLAILASLFR